jgi:hypothetical protein
MAQRNPNFIEEDDPALNQAERIDRPAIQSSAGASPEVIDPYQGGVVSSLGLQTDTANSQLPGIAHPVYRLMPLSVSGNPATNAAIQSTTQTITQQVVSTLPPIKLNVVGVSGGIVNTLGVGNGGTGLTAPGPTGDALLSNGTIFVPTPIPLSLNGETGAITLESLDSSITITTPTSTTINLQAVPGLPVVMKVNGTGVAADKQVYVNGVTDGAAVWGVKINGVADGG